MKKFLGMLLTVCIILGLLAGCGKSALEQYNDAVAKLSKSDQKFTMELAVEGDKLELTGIADVESLKLIFDGNISADATMAEIAVSLNIPSAQTTVELTDIIVDENKMYINGQKLMTLMSSMFGAGDMTEPIMGDKTYILMDTEEYMGTKEISEDSGFYTLVKNISEIYNKILKDHDAASKDGSAYLLKLDGSAIEEFLLAVIGDIKENKEVYYDAVLELYSDEVLESIGISKDDLTEQREETLTTLGDILTEIESELENADFSKSNFNAKVDDKSMETVLNFIMGDDLNMNFSYSSEKTEMDSVTAPTDYILWSEFEDALNSLNDYSSGIYGDDDSDGGTSAVDNQEFSFNTTTDESISQIHTADLSGYANLTNYNLVSDITEAEYNVPIIDGELYESTGSIYSTSDNGGVNISYYAWDLYGDEFLDYCEEDLRGTYEFYGEYGMTASFSDAYVSPDGNTVVMAMAYDLGDNYIVTEVYVFQYINEEEMLYGMIEIYNDDIDEADTTILSEYSDLLGFDLNSFLSLYEKANASLI